MKLYHKEQISHLILQHKETSLQHLWNVIASQELEW